MRLIEITADFGEKICKRTGLWKGEQIEVEPIQVIATNQETGEEFERPEAVWVRCPDVCIKRDNGFFMRSDGYAILEPHEFREI